MSIFVIELSDKDFSIKECCRTTSLMPSLLGLIERIKEILDKNLPCRSFPISFSLTPQEVIYSANCCAEVLMSFIQHRLREKVLSQEEHIAWMDIQHKLILCREKSSVMEPQILTIPSCSTTKIFFQRVNIEEIELEGIRSPSRKRKLEDISAVEDDPVIPKRVCLSPGVYESSSSFLLMSQEESFLERIVNLTDNESDNEKQDVQELPPEVDMESLSKSLANANKGSLTGNSVEKEVSSEGITISRLPLSQIVQMDPKELVEVVNSHHKVSERYFGVLSLKKSVHRDLDCQHEKIYLLAVHEGNKWKHRKMIMKRLKKFSTANDQTMYISCERWVERLLNIDKKITGRELHWFLMLLLAKVVYYQTTEALVNGMRCYLNDEFQAWMQYAEKRCTNILRKKEGYDQDSIDFRSIISPQVILENNKEEASSLLLTPLEIITTKPEDLVKLVKWPPHILLSHYGSFALKKRWKDSNQCNIAYINIVCTPLSVVNKTRHIKTALESIKDYLGSVPIPELFYDQSNMVRLKGSFSVEQENLFRLLFVLKVIYFQVIPRPFFVRNFILKSLFIQVEQDLRQACQKALPELQIDESEHFCFDKS